MAGDWIKIESATPSKPEIDTLAEVLGVTVNEVLGALVRLWIWADQQTIDGNAASVTKSAIDRHSGVTGFADALLSERVNWLGSHGDGGFCFPNFERHNGQTAKRRALTSKRVAECKKRKGNAEVTLGALPREEKRREELNTSPLKSPKGKVIRSIGRSDLPMGINTPEVLRSLNDWLEYKGGYKRAGLTALINKVSEMTPQRIVAAVEHSMTGKYKGLFEPSGNGKTTHDPLAKLLEVKPDADAK